MLRRMLLTLIVLLLAAGAILAVLVADRSRPRDRAAPHSTTASDRSGPPPLPPEAQESLEGKNAQSPPEPPEVWEYDAPVRRRESPPADRDE
jgi:hypothetical protein